MSWKIEESCLLCLNSETSSIPVAFTSFPGTGGVGVEGVDFLLDAANNPNDESCLRSHLWSIFVLRKFLQFPEEECHSILQKSGGVNPGSWFSLCDKCSELVRNACQLHVQISKLKRQMELLREVAIEKLKGSFKEFRGEGESSRIYLSVDGMIRDYYRRRFDPVGDGDLQNQDGSKDDHIVHSANEMEMEGDHDFEPYSEPGSEQDEESSDPDFVLEEDEVVETVKLTTSNSRTKSDVDENEENNAVEISSTNREGRTSSEKPRSGKIGENKFRCGICSEIIEGKIKWKHHKDAHRLTCRLCGYTNRRSEKYAGHMRGHKIEENMVAAPIDGTGRVSKEGRPQFSCKMCAFTGTRITVYKHISNIHFAEETHKCPLCPKTFFSRKNARAHVQTVHDIRGDFKCHCRKWFLTPECLKKHRKTHENEVKVFNPKKRIRNKTVNLEVTPADEDDDDRNQYKCDKCEDTIEGTKAYERHVKYHRTTCHRCGYHNKSYEQVESHVRSHTISDNILEVAPPPLDPTSPTENSQFSCKLCDFVGKRLVVYRHVSIVHFAGDTLQCETCSKTFASRERLRSHVRKVHQKLFCDQCPAKFADRMDFEDHMEWHSNAGVLTILCEKCGKGFPTRRGLSIHSKSVNCGVVTPRTKKKTKATRAPLLKVDKNKCRFCGQLGFSKTTMTAHLKDAHPEQFKYKCDLCEVLYMCHKNLRAHKERTHLKSKFTCTTEGCGYVSNTSRQVWVHLRKKVCGTGSWTKEDKD